MPEQRLERTRRAYAADPLPPPITRPWRRPSDTAAEQLAKRGITANVIEGDPFDTNRDTGDETPWGV